MPQPAVRRQKTIRSVLFVLVPRFNMMALMATLEPMRIANYLSPEPLYVWNFASSGGGMVTASNGMMLDTASASDSGEADLVFVCGSWSSEHVVDEKLFAFIRKRERQGVSLAAMDIGAYILARAGVIAGKQATLHWSCFPGFTEQFPQVDAREQLFTVDGNVITCAGGTSGLDLMLQLIALQHSEQLASEVADQIVHYPLRKGDAPQRETLGGRIREIPPEVRGVTELIERNVGEPMTVPSIAAELGVSQRQLERRFRRYMGCTVVQFSQLLRLQHARVLLTSTGLSIREVSAACGFNSMSYFSQAFVRCFGKRPSEYRQAWPEENSSPSWPGTVFSLVERTHNAASRISETG